MEPVISLQNVSFGYKPQPQVLEKITLQVMAGEFLGLIGPNGGGKTTLLKLILGLLQPNTGSISVFGERPGIARTMIGYVPQFTTFNLDFPISVADVVLMGRIGVNSHLLSYNKKDKQLAYNILEKLEVAQLWNQPIGALSGGQLQRVMVARALACEPKILLLDEPTANVDIHAEKGIFEFLKAINKDVTILVVSHDIGFISQYIEKVACINRKLVCHHTYALSAELMQDLYEMPVRAIKHE